MEDCSGPLSSIRVSLCRVKLPPRASSRLFWTSMGILAPPTWSRTFHWDSGQVTPKMGFFEPPWEEMGHILGSDYQGASPTGHK